MERLGRSETRKHDSPPIVFFLLSFVERETFDERQHRFHLGETLAKDGKSVTF